MAEPNPDTWAQLHMRWMALARWDGEGGAGPLRPIETGQDTNAVQTHGQPSNTEPPEPPEPPAP